MRYFWFISILVLSIFCQEDLLAQEHTAEETKTLNEQFYGNADYMKASQMVAEGQLAEADTLFRESSKAFKEAENWEALIAITKNIAETYEFSSMALTQQE